MQCRSVLFTVRETSEILGEKDVEAENFKVKIIL